MRGYTGDEPLSSFLRQFFSKEKKYGSRDRKAISHLCYGYFRLGHALEGLPVEERMMKALFLCSTEPNILLQQLDAALNEQVMLPVEEKMNIAGDGSLWQHIFPLAEHISEKINGQAFLTAHLRQPDLFLRIRPGYEEAVQRIVSENGLPAQFPAHSTLQLPNSINAAPYFEPDKQVVVQDYSSQQTGQLFTRWLAGKQDKQELNILDACAASGGKTMMLYDLLNGKGHFTVNDVRASIIHNLKQRFKQAGIKNYRPLVADITKGQPFSKDTFDVVIADVPCSGSGTWGRNPEHLAFFRENKLHEYAALQKKIIERLPGLLRNGGLLFYITCSVYKEENEMNTALLQQYGLKLLEEKYFCGYMNKADTMYGAVLGKEV